MPTPKGKIRKRSWAKRQARSGLREIGWQVADQAMKLDLPGAGDDPAIVLDFSNRLPQLLTEAIAAVVLRPFAARGIRPLKPSTVKRKRRAGYARPAQPCVASGSLEQSFELRPAKKGFNVVCDESAFWQDGDRFRKVAQIGAMSAAIDEAVKTWLGEL